MKPLTAAQVAGLRSKQRRIADERRRLSNAKEFVFRLRDYADLLEHKGLRKHLAHARERLEASDSLLLDLWNELEIRLDSVSGE